jgi:hypothetical protein
MKNIILINILLLIISSISSTLSFSYPTSIVLNNGDIFIIHKTGVTVTDPTCSTIKKSHSPFNGELTEDSYSRVSIGKFEDGMIVCLIFDKIHFYDSVGNFKRKGLGTITTSSVLYFSLIPYYVDINCFIIL